jgi:GcrA cell cycle regulator
MEGSVGAEGLQMSADDRLTHNEDTSGWTESRVALLTKLWSEGLSASRIAETLGGVTRNSVIGKVHRLGLSGRSRGAVAAMPRERAARSEEFHEEEQMLLVQPASHGNTALAPMPCYEVELQPSVETTADIVPLVQRCTILDLTERKCKWPIGDPVAADFYFCGARTADGLPYCDHHSRVAYQPVADRRRERQVSRA